MNHVTFCAFADIHYYPGVFPHDTVEWLDQILARADRENVDFIIHAGDLTHCPARETAYIDHYNDFRIKTYNVLGNHDNDGGTYLEALDAYRIPPCGYYHFDCQGFRFIALDPNYYRHEGVFHHYNKADYFPYPDKEWIPPEQLEWLAETIDQSPYPCVTISHQSFEREVGAIRNYAEIRKVLTDANKKCPGKVRLCINGHHHRDNIRIIDNIIYLDLNSANYDWVDIKHDCYPKDICEKWSAASHTVFYNDPISSIITLTEDGQFTINGQVSTLFDGVTRDMTGNPHGDECGRPVTPVIQSTSFKMNY